MSICIYFESYFRRQPFKKTFKPENYQEWTVVEKWSVTPDVIQEITLVNEDDYFESYYYVDLEIDSVFQEHDVKILKSERMASNNIKFIIKGIEYSCFETYFRIVDVNSENYTRDSKYRYKITLIPILEFCEETFRKPGKRTKIDLLGGLKILSEDIVSMKKGQLFSDMTIYCGNESVEAHRNILSARSTVFKKFLQGVEDEEVQSCIEIEPVIDEEDDNFLNDNLDGISNDNFLNDNLDGISNDNFIHANSDGSDDNTINGSDISCDNSTNCNSDGSDDNSINCNSDGSGDNHTNNDSDLVAIEEDELQNELDLGEPDDDSTVSSDNNVLKVRLKKVHCSIFLEFIDFIYSGQYKIPKIPDIKKAKDLLLAARDYGICDLQHKCITYLRSQMSIHTIDDIYSFACVCKCEDLQIYVLDYLKNKIIGKRRRNIHLMQLLEQGNDDIEDEEGMTTYEKIEWLKAMRYHPTYFKDILKLKKGKKIREVFSRVFPETSFDDDDVMADCRERLNYIVNVCAADLSNVDN